jgi:hypothetical protein
MRISGFVRVKPLARKPRLGANRREEALARKPRLGADRREEALSKYPFARSARQAPEDDAHDVSARQAA